MTSPQPDSAGCTEKSSQNEHIQTVLNASSQHAEQDRHVKTIASGDTLRGVEEQIEQDDSGPAQDQPPDGGYGWVVVACVFLINMHSWGLNSSYGVFIAYFTNHQTYPNATIIDFAYIAGLSIGCALLLAPVAAFTMRRVGTNLTLIFGTCFEALALIGASFTSKIWQLYLSQGICFGFGLGFLFIASVGLIPQWFDKKRSFANAIGAAGSGVGGIVYNLASQAVIQRAGFGWAYRMIGIVAFVVCLICSLLVKDRNKAVGARINAFDKHMFLRKEFLFFLAWGIFSLFGYIVLIYTLPTYATSIGLTASQGSIIGAVLNVGQAVGRPIVGLTSDRVGRINIAGGLTAVCGILCLVWWIFADSYAILVSFAFFVGTVAGTYWATIAPVGAEVLGLRDLPTALSMTWSVLVLPITFSEVMALEIREHTGFLYCQLYTGLCYLAGAACLWVVRVWKIGQLEEAPASTEKRALTSKNQADQTTTPNEQTITVSGSSKKSSVFRRAVAWQRV